MKLTDSERVELEKQAKARTGRADSSRRARLVLLRADGLTWARTHSKCDTCRRPPRVKRHEVGMAKLFLALSHSTTKVEAVTCCTTSSCLPGHARWVTVGCEAPGTMYFLKTERLGDKIGRHCQPPCGVKARQVPYAQRK